VLRKELKAAVSEWEQSGKKGPRPKQTGVLDTKAAPKPANPYPKRRGGEKEKETSASEPMQVDNAGEESDGESNASSHESDNE
jgi:hypothetical protein